MWLKTKQNKKKNSKNPKFGFLGTSMRVYMKYAYGMRVYMKYAYGMVCVHMPLACVRINKVCPHCMPKNTVLKQATNNNQTKPNMFLI